MKSRNDKGAGQGAPSHNLDQLSESIFAHVLAQIKHRVQDGETVSPSDFAEHERSAFWAAIPQLRDELPNLRPGWRTLAERHVDGIRVRERIFRLRGAA